MLRIRADSSSKAVILLGTNERLKKSFVSLFLSLCLLLVQFLSLPILKTSHAAQPSEPIETQTISISNPHQGYEYNYKGNLHTHSTNSDGSDSPSATGEWYRDNGYDFYTITDHDYVTPDPEVSGILWMGSSEEDSWDGSSGHMNHINITSPITSGTNQQRIDNTQSQGGKTFLNHPGDSVGGWDDATITILSGILGMEIFNGRRNTGYTSKWDSILSSGKTIWGLANEDSHTSSQRGNAYIVINSNNISPTKEEILNQISSGNFYASTGADLSVTVAGQTIAASTTNGSKIRWIKQSGQVIKTTNGLSDTYTASGIEEYVRVEILDTEGTTKAWSQPLTITSTHPNGLLVKAASSPEIYLIEEGKKRWIVSPLAFLSHSFSFGDVVTVTSSELALYPEGNALRAKIGALIKEPGSPRIFIVDLQDDTYYKRWITSGETYAQLGLRWGTSHSVSNEEFEEYTTSSPVDSTITHPNGCLVKSSSSVRVYWLENGEKRWIVSPFAFSSHGFGYSDIITIPQSELDSYLEGNELKARIGSLLRPENDNKVYIVDYQESTYYKRWIASAEVFTGFDLSWGNIKVISSSEAESYTTGESIGE